MKIAPITNDDDYKRVQARLAGTLNAPLMSDAEEEELRLLSKELQRYSLERFAYHQVPTDGVDEVIAGLDYDKLTLADALDAFGGLERFVEYMTRRGELDGATLEVLVGEFGLDRVELEKAFYEAAGWEHLMLDGQEACGDAECCPAGEGNWRVELAEMLAAGEREREAERELVGVN